MSLGVGGHFALNEGVQTACTGCPAGSSLMFILSACTSKHCLQPLLLHSQVMISQPLVKTCFPHLSSRISAADNATLIKKRSICSMHYFTKFNQHATNSISYITLRCQVFLKKCRRGKDNEARAWTWNNDLKQSASAAFHSIVKNIPKTWSWVHAMIRYLVQIAFIQINNSVFTLISLN